MSERSKVQVSVVFMGVAISIVMALALLLLVWARPLADDFCLNIMQHKGNELVHYYLNWTGRWASILVYTKILPRLNLVQHYFWLILAILLIYLCACYALFESIFQESTSKSAKAFLACGFFCLYWAILPSPGETFYWMSGAMEYHLPMGLGLLGMALLLVRGRSPQRFAVALGLSVLISGFHELAGIVFALCTLSALFAAIKMKTSNRKQWCIFTLVALVSVLVSALAPGNLVRAQSQPTEAFSIGLMLRVFAAYFVSDILRWAVDPRLFFASLLFFNYCKRSAPPRWLASKKASWWLSWVSATWFAAMFATMGVVTVAMKSTGPPRVHNFLCFVFLVGWVLLVFVGSHHWGRLFSKRVESLISIVFVLFLLSAPNTRTALRELYPPSGLIRWSRELSARYQSIEAAVAQGTQTMTFIDKFPTPRSFYQKALGPDPEHWRNKCFARYFGLKQAGRLPIGAFPK